MSRIFLPNDEQLPYPDTNAGGIDPFNNDQQMNQLEDLINNFADLLSAEETSENWKTSHPWRHYRR